MLFVLSEIKKKEKEKQKAVGQEGACSLPVYACVLDLHGSIHISAKSLTPGGFTQYFHYFISYNSWTVDLGKTVFFLNISICRNLEAHALAVSAPQKASLCTLCLLSTGHSALQFLKGPKVLVWIQFHFTSLTIFYSHDLEKQNYVLSERAYKHPSVGLLGRKTIESDSADRKLMRTSLRSIPCPPCLPRVKILAANSSPSFCCFSIFVFLEL